MKRTVRTRALVAAAFSFAGLSACSASEPTEPEMKDATQRLLAQTYTRMNPSAALAANYQSLRSSVPPMPRITAFRKIGCTPAHGKPGFLCEIEIAYDGNAPAVGEERFYALPDGTLALAEKR